MSVLVGMAALAGCGYIGPPMPPTLDIPSSVNDLRAIEYGDRIQVTFTIPGLTTEGLPLKSLRSVDLFIGPMGAPNPDAWAVSATRFKVDAAAPGPVTYDQLRAQDWVGKSIYVGVRATGPKGRESGWSNLWAMNVGPPLPQPADLGVKNVKNGVALAWRGSEPHYRILRATGNAMLEPLKDTDMPEYLDDSAQYGILYRYAVLALASDRYMSVASDTVSIMPMDVFPPEVPSGVTAVASANTIELAWDRNTEPDFKGYNVYRSVDGGQFEKIAPLIESATYTDTKVEPGKTYRYAISAVDLLGNESNRSEPRAVSLQ